MSKLDGERLGGANERKTKFKGKIANNSLSKVTNSPNIRSTTWLTGFSELKDHILARLGVNRMGHRVPPGLYLIGKPNPDSPVFVTANYTLSFDALRSSLKGIDGYILVLDTQGANVWTAARLGKFSTNELVNRIRATDLGSVVKHRKLILPQLSAPGVNAFEVEKRTGFKVVYGPIRARDIPEFLRIGKATSEMRLMRFNLVDRLVLIPVELTHIFLPLIVAMVGFYIIGGILLSIATAVAALTGVVLFPLLLPWLPTRDFSTKGFILGFFVALPFAATTFRDQFSTFWLRVVQALIFMLVMPPITAYLALNFTGSAPFTSRTGVKREIFKYVPVMAGSFFAGVILAIAIRVMQFIG